MDEETTVTPSENAEIIDASEYKEELLEHFGRVPEVAKPLLKGAETIFAQIKKSLYTAPAFINVVKAAAPDMTLRAVLTDEQRRQIARGALKLVTKKDGSFMAIPINPEAKKIVATIPSKSMQMAPEMTQTMTSFSTQMQVAQIAEEIQAVQLTIGEVRMGQECDRLATTYSCQQKLLRAVEVKNPELKAVALIQSTAAAKDSRNLLMLSQKSSVKFIKNQSENFIQKILSGSNPEKINGRMSGIRESLCAVNMVPFTEAMAYQELGEHEAARKSLTYYANFIEDVYTSVPGLVRRLNLIDPTPENYWSKTSPGISEKIEALPGVIDTKLLENKRSRRKKKRRMNPLYEFAKIRNVRRFYREATSIDIMKRVEISMRRPPKMFLKE